MVVGRLTIGVGACCIGDLLKDFCVLDLSTGSTPQSTCKNSAKC